MVNVIKNKCGICGHEWLPRIDKPVKCPNPRCQSAHWEDDPIIYKPGTAPLQVPREKKEEITKPKKVITFD